MRWLFSWTLYWLGDAAERCASGCEWLSYRFANLYQWLMAKASNAQGDGPGPWQNV